MATLVLGAVGTAIGGAFGGAILGFSGAAIGGFIGSTVGSVVDSWIVSSLAPAQRIEGARLDTLRITSATEGAVIPRLYGRMRVGGNIIWATDFREETKTTTQGGGKGGGGGKVKTTEYLYYASFAVALCEGPITGIGRVWADGKAMDMTGVTWRWYPGNETQTADPFIAAKMGAANTPAYRGTAYVVFEDLALATFGNRLPQLSVEVFRPLADPDTAEGLTRAVTLIPASGEFTYATDAIRKGSGGATVAENLNALPDQPDIVVALDRLQAMAPAVESVSLVVAWFGNDLRAGSCKVKPGVEVASKATTPANWSVNGISRASAHLVSRDAEDRPVYGGTPADFAVVQAIQEMKARGLRVTFYPFLLMDVPPGNTLPNPYSANAATPGQPAFPWRGRITCSPAAGFAGSVDKTGTAATQVSALFGAATAGSFSVSGETVSFTGSPSDWGLRRMVLHYAHLCAAAGGVDAFLIGTEMPGLTTIRSGASTYPAVTAFKSLAADVSAILGAGTKIGYAADWSEYFGHHPQDGSGDVYFHLDPLWSDTNIDFVGIDNYLPLSDWRDGFDHADALEGWPAIHDRAYLQANIAGGEGFDWFYASAADRSAQIRTPITDGAAGKPWVFRPKDIRAWWQNQHFNRPGGVESGLATTWVPQSKPIRFTELGCPAIDRGTNQPNVFFDPKSSESFTPYFSRGWRDDAIQRAYLEASYLHWGDPANNPISSVYGGRMVHLPECAAWTWDARPYPFFPELTDVWTDGPNWRLGHWLTGRLGAVSLAALVRHLCLRAGMPEALIDVSGVWGAVEGYAVTALEAPRSSISTLARHFGFDAIETEGMIRFVMRGRASVLTLAHDDLVASREGEALELVRAQETELPQALKWQVARADEDYDAALVEARRITVDTTRIASESFPMAIPPEEAERRCRRALMEAWIGRESATFRLPPSRLALDFFTLSQVYEDLLLKMGEKNSDGGQFFTPREVIRAMVHTVKPKLGQTVYDPCCGTGGFLAIAYEHIARNLGSSPLSTDIETLKHDTFFGREKENLVLPIALANLVLHGIDQPNLWHGNSLTRRATYAALFNKAPKQFDVILTNPPFGGKEGKDAQKNFAFETSSTQVLFVQDILGELAPKGTCAIVLDEGMLFRTNESSFVETKRKLVDECDLWAIVSLPGGVFSTAGAGVKTNLLFFTKGKKTQKIWYYDLSNVKVGKKTPLTLAHFGFGKDGSVLPDAALPSTLTAEWQEDEANAGTPYPSYARMLSQMGTPGADSPVSWTVDFAARREKAREEMKPLLDQARQLKDEVVDLKEDLKRLKKGKAAGEDIDALTIKIAEAEKAYRDLETQAANIDAAVFDLKAVNPNVVAQVDNRTPTEIIESINAQGRIVSDALARLSALVADDLALQLSAESVE